MTERAKRREQCKVYLRRAGNLQDAMDLAKLDGRSWNTSVWIGALGELLAEQETPRSDSEPRDGG